MVKITLDPLLAGLLSQDEEAVSSLSMVEVTFYSVETGVIKSLGVVPQGDELNYCDEQTDFVLGHHDGKQFYIDTMTKEVVGRLDMTLETDVNIVRGLPPGAVATFASHIVVIDEDGELEFENMQAVEYINITFTHDHYIEKQIVLKCGPPETEQ